MGEDKTCPSYLRSNSTYLMTKLGLHSLTVTGGLQLLCFFFLLCCFARMQELPLLLATAFKTMTVKVQKCMSIQSQDLLGIGAYRSGAGHSHSSRQLSRLFTRQIHLAFVPAILKTIVLPQEAAIFCTVFLCKREVQVLVPSYTEADPSTREK